MLESYSRVTKGGFDELDLRIGVSSDHILKLYHPDAPDQYNARNELEYVVDSLKDPSKRIEKMVSYRTLYLLKGIAITCLND